jgi:hypothetical protein
MWSSCHIRCRSNRSVCSVCLWLLFIVLLFVTHSVSTTTDLLDVQEVITDLNIVSHATGKALAAQASQKIGSRSLQLYDLAVRRSLHLLTHVLLSCSFVI